MLSILGMTVAIYSFFLLMGWGITRLILPSQTRPYQFWLFPWFGLMVSGTILLWFSWLGLSTNQIVWVLPLVAIGLLGLGWQRKIPLGVSWHSLDWAFLLSTLVGLGLALSPMALGSQMPTTTTLGNNDAPLYATLADFLHHHAIWDAPKNPSNDDLASMLLFWLKPGHRPEVFLTLGLVSSLLQVKTYQVFTIVLGLFYALTPPLMAIFAWEISRRWFPTLLTLVLATLNLTLLFVNYHGFAAQVLYQGSFILAFLLVYQMERGDHPSRLYLLPLGLCLSSMLGFYAEGSVFFIGPVALYVGWQLLQPKTNRLALLKRFSLIALVGLALNPMAAWFSITYALEVSNAPYGFPIARWATPGDMVGFLNLHQPTPLTDQIRWWTSLPVLLVLGLGVHRLGNRALFLALFGLGGLVLLWTGLVRHYSYGYYKTVGFVTFAILLSFALGLTAGLDRLKARWRTIAQGVSLLLVGCVCSLALGPTYNLMLLQHGRVGPQLSSLAQVPPLVGNRSIALNEPRIWELLWAIYFLRPSPTTLPYPSSGIPFLTPDAYKPFNPSAGSLILNPSDPRDFIQDVSAANPGHMIWRGQAYSLSNHQAKVQVRLGVNWWPEEAWWGDPADSRVFRWLNQDATLRLTNHQTTPLQTEVSLRLLLFQLVPQPTVDIFVNDRVVTTLTSPATNRYYPIVCQLQPGLNTLRIHVREGAIQPPGDTRAIAIGVNGIKVRYD